MTGMLCFAWGKLRGLRMKSWTALIRVCVVAVLVWPGCARADNSPEVPLQVAGAWVVTAAQVAELIADGVAVIDVRAQDDYFSARIPGALHVAYSERSRQASDFDPANDEVPAFLARLHRFVNNPNLPVILYCNGPQCWKSHKACKAVVADGYTAVHWFRGGLAEWRAAGFPTDQE